MARRRVASRQHIWLAGTIARRVLAETPMPTVGRALVVRTTAQAPVASRRHISLAGMTDRRELATLRFAVARVVGSSPTWLLLAMSGRRSPMLAVVQ
jgi:hypothetical protein